MSDGSQHRLDIRRRAGDDAQNFTGRGLLLQRFLQLLEQPDVLDGDHGLIGKGFKEFDLRWSEGTHFDAACVQRANQFPLLTKGSGQPAAPGASADDLEIVPLADVGNVERAMLAHPSVLWLINTDLDAARGYGYGTKMRPRYVHFPVAQAQYH